MKILFDHNVDRRFRKHLPGHQIQTTREKGWHKLDNGVLLGVAAGDQFDAFLSIDKKLEHQQNLATLPLPIIVIDSVSNALPALVPFASPILALLNAPLERILYVVQPDGNVLRLRAPR